ncbi:hypothetical protein ARMGADRAFT_1160541 [Armillaria gallica]|uniref:DUF6534 domain-containing protein n=1 Tax=Armillaria gallica TaxID=47427 RepID=A0A2H3E5A6_ARMGA|nr:hypothetical protein ARMGADRAFT_1160541 [Armillaria gallica]
MSSVAEPSQGPMLIGHMISVLLLGVVIAQTYIYMITYQKRDKAWLKALVFFLLVLNVANTQFAYMYTALITHFEDPAYLVQVTTVFATTAALTGVISCSVQMFFAWRVKILTSNLWLVGVVVATAIAGAIGAIASSVEAVSIGSLLRFQEIKAWVILWLVGACAADILITAILVWHLYGFLRTSSNLADLFFHLGNHKTGFQASDELVDRIIRSTVQTGLLTSICAIVDLIVYLVDPTGLHLLFNFPLSKLYTNTLLSSLNSRGGWAYDSSQSHSHTTGGIMSASAGKKGGDHVVHFGTNTRPEVFVSVEQHELADVGARTTDMEDIKLADDISTTSREPWEVVAGLEYSSTILGLLDL